MRQPTPGEHVREFYRAQGERRMFDAIIAELEELESSRENAAWSPRYVINLLRGINEARNNTDREANAGPS